MGPHDEDKDKYPSAMSNTATAFPATANVATNASTASPATDDNPAANTKTSTARIARDTIANAATVDAIAKVNEKNPKHHNPCGPVPLGDRL